MKKYLRYIAAFGTALLVSLAGIAWQILFPSYEVLGVFAGLAVLPALLVGVNLIASKSYMARIRNMKVAEGQSYLLRHRQEAQETSSKLLSKLQLIRRATALYTAALWLLGAAASVLAGMIYYLTDAFSMLWIFGFYAGVVFYAAYSRLYPREKIQLGPDAPVLKEEDYPLLFATVKRAANALHCGGEVTVLLMADCNAGILREGNKYYLQIGVMLLNILSEDELYSICLHEFSHVSDKNAAAEREIKYNSWFSQEQGHTWIMGYVARLPFLFLDEIYVFNHLIYRFATSVVHETNADRDMLVHGDAKAAASALLKLSYNDKYQWESGVYDETPVYAAESPDPDYLKHQIERFQAAIAERHKDWDAMVDLEILANNASHPTLKMRLETLGIEHAQSIEDKGSEGWQEEQQKALAYAEKRLYDNQMEKDCYVKDRKEEYLDPLARVTEWEEAGCPVIAEEFGDIVFFLKKIGRHEDAEALCDRAIVELDENSSAHAYFIKGSAMLYRYDEAGMDLVYHAIEKNKNFIEDGLTVIGQFCCMTGKEKELLEYRARAQELAQLDIDEYSQTGVLSKNDKLSADQMPEGMLDSILEFIHSVDEDIIKNIYLVRKTINEKFFTSAFVIHFWGGTDAQREEIMHKIFRYLDTYPVDWQFSLFDYTNVSDIKFDKIEGSLVWNKSNNKGE